MQAEIVMIGTELLLGQIQDTNATYMAQVLAEHGINLYQKTTVGDNRGRILAALDGALQRSEVVLCSGGLGPTEDDITRDCVAELLGRPLEYHEDLFQSILDRFAHARFRITENNKKQALLPRGAEAIENPHGTAPGILVDDPRGVIVCMPGVPGELKPMLEERVIPWIRRKYSLSGVLHYRVLKVCGIGESRIDHLMGDLINRYSNPTIGLLASPDAVRIRIAARAGNLPEANALIDPVEAEIHQRLPGLIFGRDNQKLEEVLGRLLDARGWRLAVGETMTGGMVSQRLCAAGIRAFAGARVYPGALTEGVDLRQYALDLARQLLIDFGSDCALVLAADATARCTVGLFLTPESRHEFEAGFFGEGERNQVRTSIYALEQMRRRLSGYAGDA